MRIGIADTASRLVLGFLVIVLAGCSSSPTAPEPALDRSTLLPGGSYVLLVSTAADQSSACRADPARSPALIGVVAVAALTVSYDGQSWIARNTNAAEGNLELRLRHIRDLAVLDGRVLMAAVEGTIQGATSVPGGSASSDRVTFSAATRVDGSIARSSGLGTMQGEITQSVTVGSVSCPLVRWTISGGAFPGF